MAESDLQRLKRQLDADPTNESLMLAYLHARARIDGDDVFFEVLADAETWNSTPESIQTLATDAANNRLGADYVFLGSKTFECTQKHRIPRFEHSPSGLIFHLLPGGQYKMGLQQPRFSMDKWAQPVHELSIPPFFIAQTPTTQRQWDAGEGDDKRAFHGEELPIENVAQLDILLWMHHFDKRFRLPSESEWEYACRGRTDTVRFWGDAMDLSYCWINSNSGDRTHAVTEHIEKHNNFGLVDMLGNVFEWVTDFWSWSYDDGPHDHKAKMSGDSSGTVTKGGDYHFGESYCRSGMRFQASSQGYWSTVGFRVAMSL